MSLKQIKKLPDINIIKEQENLKCAIVDTKEDIVFNNEHTDNNEYPDEEVNVEQENIDSEIKKSSVYYKRKLSNFSNERLLSFVESKLKEGRRYFGSSGASLTHHINNPAFLDKGLNPASVKVGLSGEHKTTKKLQEWIKDKPNAVLVDSIHLDTAEDGEIDEEDMTLDGGDTDHAIIIGNHIIIIDSKAWKNKKSYSINEEGQILRTKKLFAGGNVKAKGAKFLWKDYFKEYSTEISSIIVITQDEVFVVRDMNWWRQPFILTNYADLYKWLDKIYEETEIQNKKYIYTDLVAKVVSMCVKPYNIVKELFSR